jgi:hypothetical protein
LLHIFGIHRGGVLLLPERPGAIEASAVTTPTAGVTVSAPGDRKEVVVQVHCDEGGAIQIGPEPCVDVRETWAKLRLQERISQPLSFDKNSNTDAEFVYWTGRQDGRRT